jgi:hypothetical protein
MAIRTGSGRGRYVLSFTKPGLLHTKYKFQSNTKLYYTKCSYGKHVSTVLSHHQTFWRTDPMYQHL